MDVPQELETGIKQLIIWDGIHVSKDATVSIKLLYKGNWYTIASGIPFSNHKYEWNVDIPEEAKRTDNDNSTDVNVATLRVELDDNSSVYDEKGVVIKRETSSSSGGETTTPPHSENNVGCSITPQLSIGSGLFNFFLMVSGLLGLAGLRRKRM
jgi:hypothetical protein